MSERWAHCGVCIRWFYVDQTAQAMGDLRCPVCQTPASHSVRRNDVIEGAN